MYFADPSRGKRRRAIARDKIAAAWRDVQNEFDKAGHDLYNRTQGLLSAAQSICDSAEPSDAVLLSRVRSRIGRAVSHPHAIRATVDAGRRIVLEGPVLEHEVSYLLKSVQSVAGVREVISRLESHGEADHLSSLQGGASRRPASEFAQQNWTPVLRISAGALAGTAFYASMRNESPWRWASAAAGTVLLTRAIVNKGFRQIFGAGDGCVVDFDKAVHVDAPLEEVFSFWSKFENFPRFMTHLKEVRDLGNGRSHWVAEGPGGISIPWDAEITQFDRNKLLAWKSVPGSPIRTQGSVRFDREPDGRTRLTIRMSYCPPAGVFGHAVACLFGSDPKSEIDEDMVRLKSLIEIGKTRAHGSPVYRDQLVAE